MLLCVEKNQSFAASSKFLILPRPKTFRATNWGVPLPSNKKNYILMRKTFFAFMLLSFAALVAVTSCKKDSNSADYAANADCTAIVAADNTYTNSIKAILDASCATAGCHNVFSAAEGIDFSDYAKSKNAFQNKKVLCSIHHGSGCTPMPQDKPQLSDSDINKIDCWVKNGYAE